VILVDPAPLFGELKRRRVFRALVGYGIAAFAVLQIIEPIMHGLHWPEAVLSYVVAALAVGFPIVVGLAWIFDVRQGGIERTTPAPGGALRLRGARLTLVLVGIGVLAAAPGSIWYFWVRRIQNPSGNASGPSVPSIAVLPFVNLSSDKEQEYFSDGIAEEILNALAQVDGLHVTGRTSSFSFKGKNEDLRSIGDKLNVANVLEGSVRREGNHVRISAQLVSAADGYHVWSKTFDRELTGVFAVQDEISSAVVEALKVRLMPGKEPRQRAASPEVYNEYLLGKQLFHRPTFENYRRAAAAYERALALDPDFAPAWAALAEATFSIADFAETSAAITEGFQRAMAAAEKAVALDPALADGYVVRGTLRSRIKWDWEGARVDFERALALNPASESHLAYALVVLRPLERLSEAVTEAQKATDLDPLSAGAWEDLGLLYLTNGQLGAAQAALERSLRILPEQVFAAPFLAVTLLLEKRPSEALVWAEKSSEEVFRLLAKAIVLNALGRAQEAHRLVEQMIERYSYSAAYQIAEAYAWFGEQDRAFDWLKRAYAQHDSGLVALNTDVLLRSLHGDRRYTALLGKMNLRLH
jgi:TolB-like protein/tetratricopeptide (TPR) repeat protein